MTKRDKEIESCVGDAVACEACETGDPFSSNHLATQTQSCPVPTLPRETHLPPLPPTETHHTHRYLLLSQKLRICDCDLRIWDSQKLCLCLVHVCVFTENLCFLESKKLCLWSENLCFFFLNFLALWLSLYVCDSLSLLHYTDKRDRESVEIVEIVFSLLTSSWA